MADCFLLRALLVCTRHGSITDSPLYTQENHIGNRNITIKDTEMMQTVYIYRCTDTCVQVRGKVNAITLDSCKKTAVVFESTVSGIEMVNCQSVQVQVMGGVPLVSIEKTDGAHIYLSEQSVGCEFVTAKSSEMNVSVPTESGEFVSARSPSSVLLDSRSGNMAPAASRCASWTAPVDADADNGSFAQAAARIVAERKLRSMKANDDYFAAR